MARDRCQVTDVVVTATVTCPEARSRNLRAAIVYRGERDQCLVREDALTERLAAVSPIEIRDCHPVTPADGPVPVILIVAGVLAGLALGATLAGFVAP